MTTQDEKMQAEIDALDKQLGETKPGSVEETIITQKLLALLKSRPAPIASREGELIERAEKVRHSVYLACPEDVAFHIAETIELLVKAVKGRADDGWLAAIEFLLARLDEYEPEHHEAARDYYGHVEPAIARLKAALPPAPEGKS